MVAGGSRAFGGSSKMNSKALGPAPLTRRGLPYLEEVSSEQPFAAKTQFSRAANDQMIMQRNA